MRNTKVVYAYLDRQRVYKISTILPKKKLQLKTYYLPARTLM